MHAASEANGKVVLVLGAGCSFPSPTSVPMAKKCSQAAYRKLVADGILDKGDCPDPDDLSLLADAVYIKCGRQAELVKRLPLDEFRRALANRGYLIAAALLRENVISSILTLNYDLAMEDALNQLSARGVQKIARPEDMPHFASHNVVYLHRNVDEVDPEKWVLRASALESEWQGGWEEMMAQVMLTTPVVVFAGLGSPAGVLLETTQRIKGRIGGVDAYQADPRPPAGNAFFQALGLPAAAFVQLGWNEFMTLLGDRVLTEQIDALQDVCAEEARTEGFVVTNVDLVIAHLRATGLVDVGKIRAAWLSLEERYTVHSALTAPLMAHLVTAASAVAQTVGAQQIAVRSEVVEFRDACGAVLTSAMMASGRGVRGWTAMEAEVHRRRAAVPRHDVQPQFAVVAGATGRRPSDVAAPPNILFEAAPEGDIGPAEAPFVLLEAHDICTTPATTLRAVI